MKISLKQKKLKSGKFSLYLEFYKGSYIDSNGTKKHNREFEYLKLYTSQNPKTSQEKIKNKESDYRKNSMTMSESERSKKQKEIQALKIDAQRTEREVREDIDLRRREEIAKVQKQVNVAVEKVAKEYKKEFLGKIPINIDLRIAADSGMPLVEKKPDHKISMIFKEIATKVKESFL